MNKYSCAAIKDALMAIARNDKTVFDYHGKVRLRRDGKEPPAEEKWKTPRELATEILFMEFGEEKFFNSGD